MTYIIFADYVKAFKIHGDGEPTLFYYEDQNIKAINVVMKRDISIYKRFLSGRYLRIHILI